MTDLPTQDALRAMLDAATGGDWYPGCLADDTSTCNCQSILADDGRMGGVGRVYLNDGHGEHCDEYPTRDEAKANIRLFAASKALAAEVLRLSAAEAELARLRAALARAYAAVLKDAPDWFEDGSFEQKAMQVEVDHARAALEAPQ